MEELYITKKQVVWEMAEFLAPYLIPEGFKFLKSKDAFIKKTGFGHYRIYFNIINYWPLKQDYNITITCNHKKVIQILSLIEDKFKNSELTYEWLVLPDSSPTNYKELYTSEDINNVKQASLNLINDEAPKYFEKWSSLEKLGEYYKELYTKPNSIASNMNILLRLLICLKLTNNEEEYNRFINDLKSKIYDLKTKNQEEYYERALGVLENIKPV